MSTEAQVAANRANSQYSTGPKSAEGKDKICLNAFRHGLAGAFMILGDENQEDFDELHLGLRAEHKPLTPTEILLVESMAQHYWLKQRALRFQNFCFDDDGYCEPTRRKPRLALFRSRTASVSERKPKHVAKPPKSAAKSCINGKFCAPKPM